VAFSSLRIAFAEPRDPRSQAGEPDAETTPTHSKPESRGETAMTITMTRIALALCMFSLAALPASDCVKDCQRRHQDKVKICDDLFNSTGSAYYHNTQWHRDCLDQAKTEFDNCISTCK
jgi:hypothetical protein